MSCYISRTRQHYCVALYIRSVILVAFFFIDTATTEIYTLSLHDALPICPSRSCRHQTCRSPSDRPTVCIAADARSEEHTSELQSRPHLVCRLLLEKKKNKNKRAFTTPTHRPYSLPLVYPTISRP